MLAIAASVLRSGSSPLLASAESAYSSTSGKPPASSRSKKLAGAKSRCSSQLPSIGRGFFVEDNALVPCRHPRRCR